MKQLFILLLLIVPLLAHTQKSDKPIYKNAQGNWIADQQTMEASYYAIQERDSLLSENKKLRQRITNLETEKKELLQVTLAALNESDTQIDNTQEATENLNDVNDEIINVWQKLYKGSHLTALGQTDLQNGYSFGLLLSVPIDTNWSVIGTGLTPLTGKPTYYVGLAYNIF